jgi:hypothetical protein
MRPALSRAARLLLLVSLGLNLMFGAWLWVHAPWRHGGSGSGWRHAPVPQLLDLRAFRRALPTPRQGVVDAVFEQHRPAMRERLDELFAARRDVHRAIRAEPFDRAILDRAFHALRESESAAADQAQTMVADVLQQLTPTERAALAELVPRRRSHDHTRRREQRPDPESRPSQ